MFSVAVSPPWCRQAFGCLALVATAAVCACERRSDPPPKKEPNRPTPEMASTQVAPPDLSAKLAAIGCPSGVCKPENRDPVLRQHCRRQLEILHSDPSFPASSSEAPPEEFDACMLSMELAKKMNPAGAEAAVKCMNGAKNAKAVFGCVMLLNAKAPVEVPASAKPPSP